ncbi:hypothetical protein RJ639_034093 [Escallonia herrerae]|uniref:Uncharacterized protein n=1 Tax=Escallonia herrerae TaxID=1293975 RepID=A0AA89B8U9_9ASTE|nr:hypothetical protein RJ639_034093 [Escallonia herrerae]
MKDKKYPFLDLDMLGMLDDLFIDIRSKVSPPLQNDFAGNTVIIAFATVKVDDLVEKPLSFSVEKVKECRERVIELPFGFGFGKPVHGGPIVSGNDEFVLLLSDGIEGGINVWMGLEKDRIKKSMDYYLFNVVNTKMVQRRRGYYMFNIIKHASRECNGIGKWWKGRNNVGPYFEQGSQCVLGRNSRGRVDNL